MSGTDLQEIDKLIARRRARLESGEDTNEAPLLKLMAARRDQQKTDATLAVVNGEMLAKEKVDMVVEVLLRVVRKHRTVQPSADTLEGLLAARNELAMAIELHAELAAAMGTEVDPSEVAASKNLLAHLESELRAAESKAARPWPILMGHTDEECREIWEAEQGKQ